MTENGDLGTMVEPAARIMSDAQLAQINDGQARLFWHG